MLHIFGEWNKGIEYLLHKNRDLKDDELAVGIGLEITVKPFGVDKLITYKADIIKISKIDLTDEKYLKGLKAGYKISLGIDALMSDFKAKVKHNKLIEVIEDNSSIKRLINVDMVQEVRGFAFDPQDM